MFRFFTRAAKENASRIVIGIARNQFRQFNNHQKETKHSAPKSPDHWIIAKPPIHR